VFGKILVSQVRAHGTPALGWVEDETRLRRQDEREGAGGGKGVAAGDLIAGIDAAANVEVCAGDADGVRDAVGVDEELVGIADGCSHQHLSGGIDACGDGRRTGGEVECGVDTFAEQE